jgi:NADPH:quinone reductase-like Zn-dependent oxidoreductase
MKAIVKTRSGPPEVLQLREVQKPSPRPDEVLIRVHAATVTQGDVTTRRLPGVMVLVMRLLMGMHQKKIPGTEVAGEIEAVGDTVSRFSPGDRVFGSTGLTSAGSYAEYVCLPETATLVGMPANLSYEQAAAIPVGGTTALYFLRQGKIQPGQKVLIHGASGSVGSFAVQLARHFGAEVTGVCSKRNIEMVRSLGAARVIDYTEGDFVVGGENYNVIFDAAGKTSLDACRKALAPDGTFVSVQKGLARGTVEELNVLSELAEAGELRPVIDRRYPLEQAAEAHRYVEGGHKAGNVVITVARNWKAGDADGEASS